MTSSPFQAATVVAQKRHCQEITAAGLKLSSSRKVQADDTNIEPPRRKRSDDAMLEAIRTNLQGPAPLLLTDYSDPANLIHEQG